MRENMNLEKVKNLFMDLEKFLKKYGDNSINAPYKIVKITIECILTDESDEIKKQVVIDNYKKLFLGKGALSEFYVWDNDFETRKKINEPFKKIHNELWNLLKEYI